MSSQVESQVNSQVNSQVASTDTALIFHRTFSAPIEIVYAMFGGEHIAKWWAPKPYTAVTERMEFTEGGQWVYAMVGPDGQGNGTRVVTTYNELVPPTRIVMSDYFIDAEGRAIANGYGSTKTIELTFTGTQTEMVLTSAYATAADLQSVLTMGMVEGMGIALNQLQELAESPELRAAAVPGVSVAGNVLTFVRDFDVPVATLFDWYHGDKITQWWAPQPFQVVDSAMDFRAGGRWHYAMQSPAGEKFYAVALYSEVTPPTRIVYEDAFADAEGTIDAALPTTTAVNEFVDLGNGRSRLISTGIYPDAESLQVVVNMGVIEGFTMGLDQLTALLQREKTAAA